ncbi:MAG: MerR family transcriptional regulator [Arenicellales bacterium]|jgi:DNA-binding transcriptional MerR regulator
MLDPADNSILPAIPAKRYFTIGEVSELCQVKPHVLRYWEQEFSQLNPVKRRGNRRYYQRHEVELIRTIRQLLYLEGFTISGARQKLESDDDHIEPVVETANKPKVSKELIGGLINELEELTVMLRD